MAPVGDAPSAASPATRGMTRAIRCAQMSRSRSSLLAFNLREFLGTGAPLNRIDDTDWAAASAPRVRGPSMPAPPSPPAHAPVPETSRPPDAPSAFEHSRQPGAAPPGFVWVDCFFYGFWIEEHKARIATPTRAQLPSHPSLDPCAGRPVPTLDRDMPDRPAGSGSRAGRGVLRAFSSPAGRRVTSNVDSREKQAVALSLPPAGARSWQAGVPGSAAPRARRADAGSGRPGECGTRPRGASGCGVEDPA